jgi:hypothetical protein
VGGRRVFRFYVVIYISACFHTRAALNKALAPMICSALFAAGVLLHLNRRLVRDLDRSRNKIS